MAQIHEALLFNFMCRKLLKLIFRCRANYIYIFIFLRGGCFLRKFHICLKK